ncbi:MAG: hypothetical protein KF787_11875 [Phycisphaeraceae bacterium]|nr:hypothetical protein [Phycisphaerae bacterium]MBX3393333.1 hypothetical protein [Phycisphaeraceae bacterium]
MTSMPASAGISRVDERREQLAASAAMGERRNRPMHLLVLSSALLLVSCVTMLWSMSARNAARSALRSAQDEARTVKALVAEWKGLKADTSSSSGTRPNEPLTTFYSRIESAAERAGVRDKIPSAQPQSDTRDARTGAVQKKIRYQRVNDPDLGALVRWLESACQDVPGLQVYSVRIQPMTMQGMWQMDVTFSRWERPNR